MFEPYLGQFNWDIILRLLMGGGGGGLNKIVLKWSR